MVHYFSIAGAESWLQHLIFKGLLTGVNMLEILHTHSHVAPWQYWSSDFLEWKKQYNFIVKNVGLTN